MSARQRGLVQGHAHFWGFLNAQNVLNPLPDPNLRTTFLCGSNGTFFFDVVDIIKGKKRENCSLPVFSPFPIVFSKGFYLGGVKVALCDKELILFCTVLYFTLLSPSPRNCCIKSLYFKTFKIF